MNCCRVSLINVIRVESYREMLDPKLSSAEWMPPKNCEAPEHWQSLLYKDTKHRLDCRGRRRVLSHYPCYLVNMRFASEKTDESGCGDGEAAISMLAMTMNSFLFCSSISDFDQRITG